MMQLKAKNILPGLIACLTPFCFAHAANETVLTNAVPATALSGSTNSQQYFTIQVPANATNLVIKTSGGSGDVDLYVKAGQTPTLYSYDCRPYQTGNNESCGNLTQTDTTYYIMLHGYYDYSGVSLLASYTAGSQGDSGNDDGNGDSGQTTGDCEMTAAQSELLAAHNAARSEGRTCGSTYYPAAPALTWNCKLASAAARHNADMADNNIFSHTGSDGSSIQDRISDTGYNASWWGENIAAGYSSVDQVMDGWLKSSGHCSNIMNENFTEIGADKKTASGSAYSVYWTADFGRQ
ncbi:Xanthomonalisin precursor [Vibrio aerogenes CECT 7868]|uniref:Xanthomonalisin n=1 Tax=Vibrio aerogenes CECT 7868 TaxID=1216006 RepID=A0A1M5VBF1_9VIBR|nr:CAP domain-containing protein [Vibrio aerogenes]SHH72602.1 Xanthomonalisin precursor [Vibrio aerogenes CECT 7868]